MSAAGVERKLAAILAADAVGYSRLMSRDESGTARALNECRALIDPLVALHKGRVFGRAGDGFIVEFASVLDAVDCAADIQFVLRVRNAGLPDDERLLFRIGVNLDDVMVQGGDLLGDGVNVAARLEALAEPGVDH